MDDIADIGSSKSGKRPDQIGYYTGETRTILETAKSLIRVFLASVDLYPEAGQTKHICLSAFTEACDDVLDRRAKRMYSVTFLSASLMKLTRFPM